MGTDIGIGNAQRSEPRVQRERGLGDEADADSLLHGHPHAFAATDHWIDLDPSLVQGVFEDPPSVRAALPKHDLLALKSRIRIDVRRAQGWSTLTKMTIGLVK